MDFSLPSLDPIQAIWDSVNKRNTRILYLNALRDLILKAVTVQRSIDFSDRGELRNLGNTLIQDPSGQEISSLVMTIFSKNQYNLEECKQLIKEITLIQDDLIQLKEIEIGKLSLMASAFLTQK